MRSQTFAAIVLVGSVLAPSAGAHEAAWCDRQESATAGVHRVDVLQAQLRTAIEATADAGCDPFGGLLSREGCSEHVAGIRDIAHQIELAELSQGGGFAAADCAGIAGAVLTGTGNDMVRSSTIQHPGDGASARIETRPLSGAVTATADDHRVHDRTVVPPAADTVALPPQPRQVRIVGPVFLPEDDARFEAIARGAPDLPDSAANTIAAWIATGHPSDAADKGDRLGPDAAIATASVE